jgi:hypothetical protein
MLTIGDEFIRNLYETAANCYARTFIGMLKTLDLKIEQTMFVLHGGGTKIFGFAERV